jgi:hypothetical protein
MPFSANSARITLACSTAMDLSSIQTANSVVVYACIAPSHLPQSFNSSSVSLIAAACSNPTTTCSGPTSCSGSMNSSNITVNCGDVLPCSANSSVISIACPSITDLSAIQSANSAIIYMQNAPCKLPHSFNSSRIVLPTTSITTTTANSSSFVLSCGATLPMSANDSLVTLACSSSMDLSSMVSANSTTIYACSSPSLLPPSFNSSAVSIMSAACSIPTTICSGPSSCSGSANSSSLVVNCGDNLPCYANSSVITIACPTITDLSAIQTANSTEIYMHNAPCKLPLAFNSSEIILY